MAPFAVIPVLFPSQMAEGDSIERVGSAYTTTVEIAVLDAGQPNGPVPVIVYWLVAEGVTVADPPLIE